MLDPLAVFGFGAQQVVSFTEESLIDSYGIFVDLSCEFDEPARFALLNGNCEGVRMSDSSTFALTLDQLVSATAWVDPVTVSEAGLVATLTGTNPINSTVLMTELVSTGNTVNYYVRDFSGTATAADQVKLVLSDIGGWVRDTSVKNADMIRYTVPQSLRADFPDFDTGFPGGLLHIYVAQNGAVRRVEPGITGAIEFDQDLIFRSHYNGIAIDQVLANFSIYAVGQMGPAGGIVFYNNGTERYEAAPVDQGTAEWGCYGTDIPGADGTDIDAGSANTADILAGCTMPDIAARLADNYSLNGFNDWFLPSVNQLSELYLHQGDVGGLVNGPYWSSTEATSGFAWFQDLSNVIPDGTYKYSTLGVRAIRAF